MLAIRGGSVIDGSGGPAVRADVLVRDGRIVDVGPDAAKGAGDVDTLDATGLVVAPGFIDLHTHYDAQIFWDTTLSSSSWHGVTTVVGGNCGFSVAPAVPEYHELLVGLLQDLEDMSAETLRAGITWGYETFAEYLEVVEARRPYLNWAAYVGHSALRIAVLGEHAYTDRATPEEIGEMTRLADAALASGAIGIATTASPTGRNAPTRHADRDEVVALMRCLTRAGHGIGAFVPGGEIGHATVYELQFEIGRPFTWTALLASDSGHDERIPLHRLAWRAGADVHPQVSCRKLIGQVTLDNGFALRCPAMRQLDRATDEERMAAYADPAWRGRAADELAVGAYAPWDRWSVAESDRHPELVGRPVVAAAADLGVDPLTFVLDLALEERLRTRFELVLGNRNEEGVRKLLQLEGGVLGLSDAGAHPDQLCDAVLPTDLLGGWVRDRQALTLEHGVRKLTGEIADLLGLVDRGYVRRGACADVVVFDPDQVGPGPLRRVRDFPADGERLVADHPTGIAHVLVNGTPIARDGTFLLGTLEGGPGQVIRSAPHPA